MVKNPLSPTEHPGGVGVNNELFEQSLEQFVVCFLHFVVKYVLTFADTGARLIFATAVHIYN